MHDRVWVLIPWGRKSDGKDDWIRSFSKTIAYRIFIFIVATFVTMLVMDFSFLRAASLAASDFISAMVLYYIIERLFNPITWGRKVEAKQPEPIS